MKASDASSKRTSSASVSVKQRERDKERRELLNGCRSRLSVIQGLIVHLTEDKWTISVSLTQYAPALYAED